MTDYNSVAAQLALISGIDETELQRYENCISSSIEYVRSLLRDEESGDDNRIVNLCAVTAYLKIVLLRDITDDGISSFSAGDVSYKKDTSSVKSVRELYSLALDECRSLVKDNGFSFKVV